MVELPPEWVELSRRDYIDGEQFGKFVDAWGKKGDNDKFEKIIGVYFRKETKYPQGQVYVFEETEYGKTRLQQLAEKIRRQESVEKPILERSEGTMVGQANTSDEAIDRAFSQMDS